MTAPLLSPAELRPMLQAVIDANPDATNPRENGACQYTASDDPARHCIAGQVAANQGWRLPPIGVNGTAAAMARRYGWPLSEDGIDYLLTVQGKADYASRSGLPWSSITLPEAP